MCCPVIVYRFVTVIVCDLRVSVIVSRRDTVGRCCIVDDGMNPLCQCHRVVWGEVIPVAGGCSILAFDNDRLVVQAVSDTQGRRSTVGSTLC